MPANLVGNGTSRCWDLWLFSFFLPWISGLLFLSAYIVFLLTIFFASFSFLYFYFLVGLLFFDSEGVV